VRRSRRPLARPARPARRRLAGLAAAVLLAAGAVRADDDLGERLAACAACHGARGEGVSGSEYYPHLAGKPAGYLAEQLRHFRDGRRVNAQMTWLVQFMDDAYIEEIARFYAAQPPRTRAADADAPLAPGMQARAEALVLRGDAARGIPACADCHGRELTGLEPGIPALVGLPAEYLVAQFGNWRNGIRRASEPDCMGEIARRLAPEDIRAVAVWLSRQSHADERRPAPAGAFVPPLACGMLPHAQVPR